MFCQYCGTQIADDVKFCPACGKPTEEVLQNTQPNYQANNYDYASSVAAAVNVKYKSRYNIGNFILWAGCAIALLSLFLNFATASIEFWGVSESESVKLIETDDGKVFLGLLLAIAVINIFKLNIVTIIGSGFNIFLLNMEIQNIHDNLRGFESMLDYGAGRTLLTLGSILMLLASIAAFVINIRAKKAAGKI